MRVVIRGLLREQIVDVGILGNGKKEDARWHVPQRDAYETKVSAQHYIILRRSHGQVTKVPGLAPHITRVFCRQQVQDAAGQGLSPHPETEASGNHKKSDLENP